VAEEQLSYEHVQRRLKEDPENKDLLNQLAMIFTVEKDFMKAVDTYFRILKIDPNNFHAYNNLGILYKKVGQYKDSLFCYQKAAKLNPGFYLVHYNIGLAYEAMGRMQEAREAYGRALSLNPEFTQALERLKELSDGGGTLPSLADSDGRILVADSPTGAPKTIGKAGTSDTAPSPTAAPPKTPATSGTPGKTGTPAKTTAAGTSTAASKPGKKGSSEMVRTLRDSAGTPFYNKAMDALEKGDLKAATENYVNCILADREFLSEPDNGLIQKALGLLNDRPNSMSEGLFFRGTLKFLSGNSDGAYEDMKAYIGENAKGPYRSQAQTLIDRIDARIAAAKEAEAAKLAAQRLETAPQITSNASYTPRPDDTEIRSMSVETIIEEGKRLSREGRQRDAIVVLKGGLDKEKDNLPLLMAMANTYTDMLLLQGDIEAGKMARDLFEKVISITPSGSRDSSLAKSMVKELSNRLR
jgi:tetratricopeptide (TPR) repeat protein